MRLSLTLVGLILAIAFGMLTVVNGMQTANGEGDSDDAQRICEIDDGDDDLETNPEPDDNPDNEDQLEETGLIGAGPLIQIGGPEDGDPEDDDPGIEDDDCPTPVPFGFCGNMTAPGAYLFDGLNYTGNCLFLSEETPDFTIICTNEVCTWNDRPRSMMLVGPVGDVYLCLHTPPDSPGGFCVLFQASAPDLGPSSLDMQSSSLFFGANPLSVSGPVPADDGGGVEPSYVAADADCDGGVSPADALTNLLYLSGYEVGCVGDWDGDSYHGDADCSGAIAAGDVVAILTSVASGSEPDC